jgi:tagatose-6-phosphate ketose/aldose isomerase
LLSPKADVRRYELDVLREVSRKQLGMAKLIVGADVPPEVIGANDVYVDAPFAISNADTAAVLNDVVVTQLLAFFRCLHLGCKPDAPSEGVLTRVVEDFAIHGASP